LLRKTEGLVTGTAHGSIVQAPDGEWWQFYTIVLSNPPGGRRIGMDRVRFDEDGLISVTVTDSPIAGPGTSPGTRMSPPPFRSPSIRCRR
jgi:Glycosyl hydrolases family 43.